MTAPSPRSRRRPAQSPSSFRRAWRVLAVVIVFLGRLLRALIAVAVLAALVLVLPWALVHYVGWPLPHHVPTWPELRDFLLSAMSTTFLLDFLACACWITWFAFTVDVLRCTIDIARSMRWPDLSEAGPMHTLAGLLVGAILLSVLGNRPAPAPSGTFSGALGTGSAVVATAPAWLNPAQPNMVMVRQTVFTTPTADTTTTTSTSASTALARPVSVIVRAPVNGVHDSLWRIAQRTLGDGNRWPEIFHANEGKPQPGGRTFTTPSLIYPGQELDLPADTPAPPPSPPPASTPSPAPTPTSPPPATSPPPTSPPPSTHTGTPAPRPEHTPAAGSGTQPASTREPGFSWGPEVFVGLGLVAAVSAALLVARRRYRARYQPGSDDHDDYPVAPLVYQLRLAHLRAEQDDGGLDDDARPQHGAVAPLQVIGGAEPGSAEDPLRAPRLGVRDGREIALDLATARGLGLVGPGGLAAVRALLVAGLSTTTGAGLTDARVVVPAEDLVAVLGRAAAAAPLPARLRVVDSLDAALNLLESETLVRAGIPARAPGVPPSPWPALMLAAQVPAQQRTRLQAVLDNGSGFGITGLLIGQWQPGVTAYVRVDGTVSATSPGLGEDLRGTTMFRLGHDDTAALLALLHQTDPRPAHDARELTVPQPRPRVAPARPAPASTRTTLTPTAAPARNGAESLCATELEITSEAPAATVTDTELEITRPTPGTTHHPASTVQESDTGAPSDAATTERTTSAGGPAHQDATAPAPVDETHGAAPAAAPLRVAVFGPQRVFWRPTADPADTDRVAEEREITGALQPKPRELILFLALHPDGATRETVVSSLWSDHPEERSTNALNTTLSRLRRALHTTTGGTVTDIVIAAESRYRLDPEMVEVDYWRFDTAVAGRRAATTDAQRVDAYRAMVDAYGGLLAEGMDAEWIDATREAIRRDALNAVSALARALVERDPQQTLDLLEVARAFDPHNESLYRDIMRLQERLGQIDSIPRTLALLTTRMAEVDDRPTEGTVVLADRLWHRHDAAGADQTNGGGVRPSGGRAGLWDATPTAERAPSTR